MAGLGPGEEAREDGAEDLWYRGGVTYPLVGTMEATFGLRPSSLRCTGVRARSEKSGSLRIRRYMDSIMFPRKRMRMALTAGTDYLSKLAQSKGNLRGILRRYPPKYITSSRNGCPNLAIR